MNNQYFAQKTDREILDEIFPFTYSGGGYYRMKYKILPNGEKKDFKKGESAPVLHGNEVPKYIINKLRAKIN